MCYQTKRIDGDEFCLIKNFVLINRKISVFDRNANSQLS